jgi:hypothetical protein
VVGIVPDDPEGDRVLLDLSAAGVSHAAVLRGPARSLESADVDLALRYLSDVRVVVSVGMEAAAVAAAADRASWAGAPLVVIGEGGQGADTGPAGFPDGAIVLEAAASDPDGTFAGFIGSLVARMDAGATPADAWAATTRALAVDPV